MTFHHKKDGITDELHSARKIVSDLQFEVTRIRTKFTQAGFPRKVIENTTDNFNKIDEEFIISKCFFNERNLVTIHLPFSNDEKFS